MEILGHLSSRVQYNFKNVSMDLGNLKHSPLPQKITEKFSFSELKSNDLVIGWEGGMFTRDSKELIVSQLALNADEGFIGTVVLGESSDGEEFLDSVCEYIDGFKLLDPMCDAEKDLYYSTMGRVKLNVLPTAFISKDYLEFLKGKREKFETEYHSVEVHPIGIDVSIVLRPNLSEISKLSLNVAEMASILRGTKSKAIQLLIRSVEDYNNRIYSFIIRFDSETVINILTDLERQLGTS